MTAGDIDSDGDLVGAHNGNVVNNVELREAFIAEGMVVRSTNDGASWADVTGTLAGWGSNQVDHAQALAIHPSDPDEIFVGGIDIARKFFD